MEPRSIIRQAHMGAITCLVPNKSSRYLLSGGQDRSINLYNIATTTRVQTYSVHAGAVLGLDILPDGSKFVSGGADRKVTVWDVERSTLAHKFFGHEGSVTSVSWGANGDLVVSGSWDGTVRFWDCRSNDYKPLQVLSDSKDGISAVEVDENAKVVYTGSLDGHLRAYDIRKGVLVTEPLEAPISGMRILEDGVLVIGTLRSKLVLLDVSGGNGVINSFQNDDFVNEEYALRPAISGSKIVSASETGTAIVWNLNNLTTNSKPEKIPIPNAGTKGFAIAGLDNGAESDDLQFATSTATGDILIY